jgi:cardiolipin synthase
VTRRDIPNLITAARIALVWPLVDALLEARFTAALVLFALAGISDGIDGFLARHYGWFTRLGAILDPVADKLLVVSVYVALGWEGFIPLWLVAAVITRDVIIVAGAAAYRFLAGHLEMAPTAASKLNTFLQIALVLAVMLAQLNWLPGWFSQVLLYAVLISTVFSGLQYVLIWGRRAAVELHRGK